MIFAQSYKNLSYLQKKKENFSSFIKEKQYLCTLINQKYDMPQSLHIAIIGGGAAGFFAAIEAKRNFPHADITIFEKNSKVLAKVEITGGGRCNLTNSFEEISDLKQAYPRGHKLMKRLFKRFDYQHAFNWFEENGVPLVTQEDQCVFPQSQDSHSIIDCLVNTAKRLGVKIQCNHQLTAITERNRAGAAQRDDRGAGTLGEQGIERRDAARIIRGQDARQRLALSLVGTDQVDRRPGLHRQLASRRWIKDRIEPQLVSANNRLGRRRKVTFALGDKDASGSRGNLAGVAVELIGHQTTQGADHILARKRMVGAR